MFATEIYAGDGSKTEFDVKFDYIQRDHVKVYRRKKDNTSEVELTVVSGTPTGDQYQWQTNSKIKVGTTPGSDQEIKIQRTTPDDDQIIQWKDGSYIVSADLNTSDQQFLYLIQELTDHISTIDDATGGATSFITEAEATKDPTNPAWSGDAALASAGAIDRIYSQIVGDGSSYPGTGNKGKQGKLRIDTSGATPALYCWDVAGSGKWVEVKTDGKKGDPGKDGAAATIAVGKTTTTAAGTDAKVTNSGSTSAAVFDFEIPRGEKGEKGDAGDSGVAQQSDWAETDTSKASFIKSKPTIPAAQVQSNWAETDNTKPAFILNKPTISEGGKTDLDYTKAADKGTVTNSTGTDAEIPLVDGTNAGLMSPAQRTKLEGLTSAFIFQDTVDLTGSTLPSPSPGASDDGFTYGNVVKGTASKTWADVTTELAEGDSVGVNDLVVWDGAEYHYFKNSFTPQPTNLSYVTADTSGEVQSSTGDNCTIPGATTTAAGLMSKADKVKLDGVSNKTDLGYTAATDGGTITSSSGNDAQIPVADATNAGLFTAAQKTKLDGISAGADVNVATNLTEETNDTQVIIRSSTGTDVTIDPASSTGAGCMSKAQAERLAGIAVGAEANVQSDWNESDTTSDAFIQNKPSISAAANDGKMTIAAGNGLQKGVSDPTNFSANQSVDNTMTFSAKAGNNTITVDSDGIKVNTANLPTVSAGNGQINVNGGNGITASGDNATANQSSNTTRTLSVKAGNNTITVDSDGVKVNTANLGMPGAANNGAINVEGGNGISASGANATANQSTATTRTLAIDLAATSGLEFVSGQLRVKAGTGISLDGNGVNSSGSTGNFLRKDVNESTTGTLTSEGFYVNDGNAFKVDNTGRTRVSGLGVTGQPGASGASIYIGKHNGTSNISQGYSIGVDVNQQRMDFGSIGSTAQLKTVYFYCNRIQTVYQGELINSTTKNVRNAEDASSYIQWLSGGRTVGTEYFVSDVRLKENIEPTTVTASDLLKKIDFISFNWNAEERKRIAESKSKQRRIDGEDVPNIYTREAAEKFAAKRVPLGFKAQQLEEVCEKFTYKTTDGTVNVSGNQLLTYTMKALQEALGRIDQLEAEVNSLKGTAS